MLKFTADQKSKQSMTDFQNHLSKQHSIKTMDLRVWLMGVLSPQDPFRKCTFKTVSCLTKHLNTIIKLSSNWAFQSINICRDGVQAIGGKNLGILAQIEALTLNFY